MKRKGTNLEGKIRYPFEDRKAIISALKPIDEVIECMGNDAEVAETIRLIKPDIFVKEVDRGI